MEIPWRAEIGGKGKMWGAVGILQFEYLVSEGLEPEHTLLDVGCGSLRGGVHFVPYLDPDKYYGIDKQGWLLHHGLFDELSREDRDRVGGLETTEDFTIPEDWPLFDYAIAQSLFTHLPPIVVGQGVRRVVRHLAPGGRFYATFFNPRISHPIDPVPDAVTHPAGIISFREKDPYHYKPSFFEELARSNQVGFEYVGGWNHPRDQEMVVFINSL